MAKVEEEATVGMLSVKLPTFWPDMPEVWFAQAEANFRARRITSQKSKFNLVVVALDADTLKGVLDLIEREPDEESYNRLKARLVQAYKLSTVDKVKQCMELPLLTEENPIKLADQMIALTRDATAEDIVKTMFLLKLPDSVRKAMWAEPLKDWAEMKARAKGLWHAEKTKRQAATYEVAGARTISQDDEVETNAVRFQPKGKNNQNSKKFKDFAGTFYQRPNGPCVFHEFYGQSATRCRSPCSQAGNGKAGRQ